MRRFTFVARTSRARTWSNLLGPSGPKIGKRFLLCPYEIFLTDILANNFFKTGPAVLGIKSQGSGAMSIRDFFIAGLLGIVVNMPAQGETRTVIGAGMGCGDWTRARLSEQRGNNNVGDLIHRYQMFAWVTGYLSGANEISQGPDFLTERTGTSTSAIEGWIDNYCKANPLDSMAIAAAALKTDLQTRSRVEK